MGSISNAWSVVQVHGITSSQQFDIKRRSLYWYFAKSTDATKLAIWQIKFVLPQELQYPGKVLEKMMDYTPEDLLCVFFSRYINATPVYSGAICTATKFIKTGLPSSSQMTIHSAYRLIVDLNWYVARLEVFSLAKIFCKEIDARFPMVWPDIIDSGRTDFYVHYQGPWSASDTLWWRIHCNSNEEDSHLKFCSHIV